MDGQALATVGLSGILAAWAKEGEEESRGVVELLARVQCVTEALEFNTRGVARCCAEISEQVQSIDKKLSEVAVQCSEALALTTRVVAVVWYSINGQSGTPLSPSISNANAV